jgi:hypothetical protein
MSFTWRTDSIDVVEVFRQVAQNEIGDLLIEIKTRHLLTHELAWLKSVLSNEKFRLDEQVKEVQKAESECNKISAKLAKIANEHERHVTYSKALSDGVPYEDLPADIKKDGLKIEQLNRQRIWHEEELKEKRAIYSNLAWTLDSEQKEYKNGLAHIETMERYLVLSTILPGCLTGLSKI